MSKNVTLRMDEELLKAFRHKAVDAQMSLSAWIVSTLKKTLDKDMDREKQRNKALQRLRKGYPLGGVPIPRDEIHAR